MKNKKILYVSIALLLIIVIVCTIIKLTYKDNSKDSIRFKEEYESYNNNYLNININKTNPAKYSNYDEILNIIENSTGVIYIGYPDSNWCRNAIPVLLNVLRDNNINTLYYINIKDDMDYYTIEDNKLTYLLDENGNEKKGKKGYFKLLKALDDYLTEYIIVADEETYNTGKKRIYVPTVVFVKDGTIIGVHTSTVVSHVNQNNKLTKKEKQELYDIYEDYIINMTSQSCSTDKDSGC